MDGAAELGDERVVSSLVPDCKWPPVGRCQEPGEADDLGVESGAEGGLAGSGPPAGTEEEPHPSPEAGVAGEAVPLDPFVADLFGLGEGVEDGPAPVAVDQAPVLAVGLQDARLACEVEVFSVVAGCPSAVMMADDVRRAGVS